MKDKKAIELYDKGYEAGRASFPVKMLEILKAVSVLCYGIRLMEEDFEDEMKKLEKGHKKKLKDYK